MKQSKQHRPKLYEAVELGRLGGLKTAKRGADYYRQIALKGLETRRKRALEKASDGAGNPPKTE